MNLLFSLFAKSRKNTQLLHVLKLIPAFIFMGSGLTKLITLHTTVSQLSDSIGISSVLSLIIVTTLVSLELIIGLGIYWDSLGAIKCGITLLIIFSIVSVYKTQIGDTSACLCFGTLFDSRWGIPLIVRNIAIIGMLLQARCSINGARTGLRRASVVLGILITIAIGAEIISIRDPSPAYEQIHSLLSVAEPMNIGKVSLNQSTGRAISIILFSPYCRKCKEMAPRWNGLADRMEQESGIPLAAISLNDSVGTHHFMRSYGLNIPVFFIPRIAVKEIGVIRVPQYLIVEGKELKSFSPSG